MIIYVRRRPGDEPPSTEDPGDEIWRGDSTEAGGESGDPLPASVLAATGLPFEVGAWIRLDKLLANMPGGPQAPVDGPDEMWTEVTVPIITPAGEEQETVAVRQAWAAEHLLSEVIRLARDLEEPNALWIRID